MYRGMGVSVGLSVSAVRECAHYCYVQIDNFRPFKKGTTVSLDEFVLINSALSCLIAS